MRNVDGTTGSYDLKAIHNVVERGDGLEHEVEGYSALCERITERGECGSPYIGFAPMGPLLLGLHTIGGYTNTVIAIHLPLEMVEEARIKLDVDDVEPCKFRVPVAQSDERILDELHPKSVFRFIEKGTASVYGSASTHRAGGRSHVTKTFIHDDMLELGYENKFGAPVLNHWQPWRQAAIDIMSQQHTVKRLS